MTVGKNTITVFVLPDHLSPLMVSCVSSSGGGTSSSWMGNIIPTILLLDSSI